jgi:hypothetical protein
VRPGARAEIAWLGACVLAAGIARAQSADRTVVQGLQDLEVTKTDAGSLLLGKNDGATAAAGALRLWMAAELVSGLQGVVLGAVEGGKASDDPDTRASIEQAFLRYSSSGKAPVTIELGKVIGPFGNFNTRYLSNANPLIGAPDGYDVSYPVGLVVSGRVTRFDYRVALLDRPLANRKYVPPADGAARPGLELGVTPIIGLRIAAFATQGPYLGHRVESAIPSGQGWRDFDQRVAGVDLSFSRGYFELNGEGTFSAYQVPTRATDSRGRAWFIEPKYTWTPRFFTALRLERNDYPYIQPVNSSFWVAQNAAFYDVEVGAGWRFTSGLLLKASYRRDRWDPSPNPAFPFPNGYAVALQLSYSFDVKSWFEPR